MGVNAVSKLEAPESRGVFAPAPSSETPGSGSPASCNWIACAADTCVLRDAARGGRATQTRTRVREREAGVW